MAELLKRDNAQVQQVAYFDLVNIETVARRTLVEARERARAMLAEASAKADAVRVQAEADIEQARQHARDEGRHEGIAQGRDQGRNEAIEQTRAELAENTASTRQTVEALARGIQAQGRVLHEQACADLVRLACAIARKVVKKVVQEDALLVQRTLEQAIELAATHGAVTVNVNPQDADSVARFLPDLATTLAGMGDWEIVGDASVDRGGCVIRTQRGELDARLGSQLDRIERELLHEK